MIDAPPASLSFLGGVGTVTGSRFLIERGRTRVLVECGLFQGLKALRLRNWEPFPVPPETIDAVVITHSHLDHVGYLPALHRAGFQGPVYATEPSIELSRILLLDAGHLQEEEAEHANRRGYSKHDPALPLFTREDAQAAARCFVAVPQDKTFDVAEGISACLQPAGHILGASTAELAFDGGEHRVLFSGDIGRPDPPLVEAPRPARGPLSALLVESTYGDRALPPREEALERLAAAIRDTLARGGWVVVPAFAIDRTPSILFGLRELMAAGRVPAVPVFVDSPMALRALAVYREHAQWFDSPVRELLEAGEDPFDPGRLVCARTREESMEIAASTVPGIILSASGMATGGRVLHHLRRLLPDPRNTVVLTGFQAVGTRGRRLADGETYLKIHGHYVPVRARVEQVDGFSAHADRVELLRWLSDFSEAPDMSYVVHGEPESAEALRNQLERELGWPAVVPRLGERVALP